MKTIMRFQSLAVVAVPFGFAIMAGCDSPPSEPETPTATVVALSPQQVTGVVGELADPAPHVRVVDMRGRPLPIERIKFVTLFQHGTLEQADTITDANGEARARWRFGTAPVQNVLSVYLPDRAGGLAFNASVAAGPATGFRRDPFGVLDAVAFAGESLDGAAVVVHDRFGNPTTGTQVEFVVTQGGGTLGGRTAWRVDVSQSSLAQPPHPWTLGQPGLNTLVATLAEGPSVSFDVFVLDSASVSWFVTQTTGTSRQKLALSASGHFVHEFWNGESLGPRFTGRYEIVSGKINLSGCVVDDYYGPVCYSSAGEIANDVITLYGQPYTKSL